MMDLSNLGVYDLKKRFGYAQIITHTDLDGYGAGAVLTQMLVGLGFNIDDIEITHTEYIDAFPVKDKYNLVFLSDISLSNGDDCDKVLQFASNPNNLLFWFDHHWSSIEMYKHFPMENIPGIRDTNACGALLCYIFSSVMNKMISYYGSTEDSDLLISDLMDSINRISIKDIRDVMLAGSEITYNIFIKQKEHELKYTQAIPFALRLTDDYDRFVLADENSKYLTYAFKNYPGFKHSCKSKYFRFHYLRDSSDPQAHAMTNKYIKEGRKIFIWSKIFSLTNIRDHGFISSLLVEGCTNLDIICVNTTTKGSMNFGRCIGNYLLEEERSLIQYNYAMAYNHDPMSNKFIGSIYCADPQNPSKKEIGKVYNAADICKKLHGGGHPGAAGFTIDSIPFINQRELPQRLIDQINDEIRELYIKINSPEYEN